MFFQIDFPSILYVLCLMSKKETNGKKKYGKEWEKNRMLRNKKSIEQDEDKNNYFLTSWWEGC